MWSREFKSLRKNSSIKKKLGHIRACWGETESPNNLETKKRYHLGQLWSKYLALYPFKVTEIMAGREIVGRESPSSKQWLEEKKSLRGKNVFKECLFLKIQSFKKTFCTT